MNEKNQQITKDVLQPDYDHLWKEVITELFEEFLLFFAPDLYEHVDFKTPPESLEQEQRSLFPDSESNNRVADKLVKVRLKSGKEQWVYIHIEIQGYSDPIFSKRMFQCFYRVLDLYDQQIYALALFTGEPSINNTSAFIYDFFGTNIIYRYNTYKISSQNEVDLLQSNNPFALAVLAGLYVLKSKKDTNLKLLYKQKLMRLLLEGKIENKNINRDYIRKLFIFIDHILRLPEEKEIEFITQLKPLIEKEAYLMGLSLEDTSFARYYRKEGFEEGLVKGKEEGELENTKKIATRLLQKGFPVEEVAEVTGLSIDEVREIKGKPEL